MQASTSHSGAKDPRIQLQTIRELLDGKGVDYPHLTGSNITHRRVTETPSAVHASAGDSATAALTMSTPRLTASAYLSLIVTSGAHA